MSSVVFMGTPEFCVPILKGLLDAKYDVKAVVTQPDRPFGRKRVLKPSPAKLAAEKLNIQVLQPEKISGSQEMDAIIDMHPDYIVTAAFGQFLPERLLNAAKIAAINVHGSLLPKYRGGAPVQYSIMNGDNETGITIMYMVKKMDAGDILAQQSVPIEEDDDTESMFHKLSLIGRDLLLKTLPKLATHQITPVRQDPEQVIFSPNITRDQEKLDFNQPARLVDAKVRALRPDPGAFINNDGKRVRIWDTTPLAETTNERPGTIVDKNKHQLKIAAGEHTVLQIDALQPAGKKRQAITDYLNGSGQKLKVGDQMIDDK